jgi:hypothetical protein
MPVVKPKEEAPEEPEPEEKPVEEPKPKEEEPKSEQPKEPEKKEEPPAEDPLLKQLKEASPEFAELCNKKGVKDIKTAVKLYQDQEASFTQRSQMINDYRKQMEPYYTFDETGKITGLTELGQKLKTAQEAKDQQAQQTGQDQQVDPQELQQKFWEKFEQDPLNTLVSIVQAVAQQNNPPNDFNQKLESLRGELKPFFDQQQQQKAQTIIDDVINEQVSSGDAKAKEFFEKYDPEIQAELNKMTPDYVKANPKLAISQAYKVVKAQKIQDFQNQLLKKQQEGQAKEASGTDTGTGSNAPVEPNVDPDLKSMQDALDSRPEGAFFV